MRKILIAEDNVEISDMMKSYLEKAGHEVYQAFDGADALRKASEIKPDLALLDIMMPKKNGMDVCKEIRQISNVPIIMLTARAEEIDRVLGLELGADDYIVKPFSTREVVARVKAVLRRFTMLEKEPAKVIKHGNLEININNYDVRLNGRRLNLTPKEVEIFQLLASHPGKVFSREQILSAIWGYDYFGDTRAVDTQIKRIRQKINPNEVKGWEIKTVYGVGYRFEVYDEDTEQQ